MDELVQLIVKTYGIAGLIMLSPFLMLMYVWRHNQRLAAEVSRVQESRVNDAKAISEKMLTMVEEQAGLNKETNIALDQVRDLLSKITTTTKRI